MYGVLFLFVETIRRRFDLPEFNQGILHLIQGYFYNNDCFNFNFAQAKVATGAYEEGEELLLSIQNEKLKGEYAYLSNLCRCCKFKC
jgi:intraflagellar transport protein 56